jgi:phosphotransferase system  glucose/maltose/N-acetylglucosamine-specific IIC component
MITRFIAVTIGVLVTFGILYFATIGNVPDQRQLYLTASIVGGIAAFFWPVVAGFWAARRLKNRRDEQIQKEVDKQMAEQNKPG